MDNWKRGCWPPWWYHVQLGYVYRCLGKWRLHVLAIIECQPYTEIWSWDSDNISCRRRLWRTAGRQWSSGAVGPDGAIFCLPNYSKQQVLRIDPFQEFATKLKTDMEEHLEALASSSKHITSVKPFSSLQSQKMEKPKSFKSSTTAAFLPEYSMGRYRNWSIYCSHLVWE